MADEHTLSLIKDYCGCDFDDRRGKQELGFPGETIPAPETAGHPEQ